MKKAISKSKGLRSEATSVLLARPKAKKLEKKPKEVARTMTVKRVKRKFTPEKAESSEASDSNDDESVENIDVSNADVEEDVKPDLDEKAVHRALKVLRELAKISDAKRNSLLDDPKPIIVQIECIKIPKCTTRKLRFRLPHTLVEDNSEICLIVSDLKKGKRVDHEPTIQHYEDLLREKGITNIKNVLPVRQLRVEYDQMEMKRRLLTQFDFFLADAKVSGLIAHKLGKTFFRKNRLPTPLKLDAKDLKAEVDKALHKTVMRLHGGGNTFSFHVANASHTQAQSYENVEATILQFVKQFPGGWENVRSVYLKNPLSMAIPIYMTLKNKNSVKQTVVKPLYSDDTVVEDELTTILGARVKVFSSGKVSMTKDNLTSDESENEAEESVEAENDLKSSEITKEDNNEVAEKEKPKKKRKQQEKPPSEEVSNKKQRKDSKKNKKSKK